MLTLASFLNASYLNPGFISAKDIEERNKLRVDNDNQSQTLRKQDSEVPGFLLSPSKLRESLNSPKNAPIFEEVLDSTSLPPKSPERGGCQQATEPSEDPPGPLSTSGAVSKPSEEYQNEPTPRSIGAIDSDATDDEHMDDIRAPQNSIIFIPDNLKSEDLIVVEPRRCPVCDLEQPLRCKHCRDCAQCVALHDHHCPWLGNCVGERNRRSFYWYLVFECCLLWLALVLVRSRQTVGSYQTKHSLIAWGAENGPRVVCSMVMGLFCLMVSCLLGFHTYLALTNQTTCECYAGESVSWEKISYLKVWPSEYGSPFSYGCWSNFLIYCCYRVPRPFRVWKMPKHLPEQVPNLPLV